MIASSSVKVYPGHVRGWPLLSSSSNRSKRYHWYRGLPNIICQRVSNKHKACMPIRLSASRFKAVRRRVRKTMRKLSYFHIYIFGGEVEPSMSSEKCQPGLLTETRGAHLKVITDPIALYNIGLHCPAPSTGMRQRALS